LESFGEAKQDYQEISLCCRGATLWLETPVTASSVTLGFPSTASIAGGPGLTVPVPLGAAGGDGFYVIGDYVTQTFVGTGLSSTTSSEWVFSISDDTYVGADNTFDVLINGTVIGSFTFLGVGHDYIGPVNIIHSFDLKFTYAPIAGDSYTLAIIATSTVPLDLASWSWVPGGTVMLSGEASSVITISVNEGVAPGTVVVSANTVGSGVTYSLTGTDASAFSISNVGVVSIINTPSFEQQSSYNFTIDAFGSAHVLLSTEAVTLNINDLSPVVVVSAAFQTLKAGQPDLITFTLSKAVTGFDNADVSVSGGTLSTITQLDATHYSATFMPAAGVMQTATIEVLASGTSTSAWADLAGTPGTASNILSISEDTKLPMLAPDRVHVQQSQTVTVNTTHGVLANDSDPISGDTLSVSAVNGGATNVGHALAGSYGALTLNANGSYSYTADHLGSTANHWASLLSGGVGVDTFSYTAIDRDGNSATSTLTVVVTSPGQTYVGGTFGANIHGGFGFYVLDGGGGNDSLVAGIGVQTLIGGPNDALTGAPGFDAFVFAPNFGKNTITNFNPLLDSIQLPKSEFANYAVLHMQQVGHDTVITAASNPQDTIILTGISPASLHAFDFHFG
jgi:VCBS repeat-containing protein